MPAKATAEIGETFRCSVVLKPGSGPGEPPSYSTSINRNVLGRHADREAAMRAVEKELKSRMVGCSTIGQSTRL